MPDLPARPNLEQLRRQAKDLLHAAKNGDSEALETIGSVSDRFTLASAQLAVARSYGFPSWTKLKREVERRSILDARDLGRLSALLAEDPRAATSAMEHWRDHPRGAFPLSYVAMLRYDTSTGTWRDLPGTAAIAQTLLDAGARVDGQPGDPETPLITAASYGDPDVARVLIAAGADVDVRSAEDSGGVPGGTALLHAAVFGMTDVVDLLVEAGARIDGIEVAAAAGDVDDWLAEAPADARLRALVMAADHQRLAVIDQLVTAGTPVDATDEAFGRQPLRTAAGNGRPQSVRRLLAHGADPNLRDDEGRTPLDLCRRGRHGDNRPEWDEVEAILAPLTSDRPAASPHRSSRGSEAGAHVPTLTVEILGTELPGIECGPGAEGQMYRNIHVGLARRTKTVELFPGNSDSVRWTFEITLERTDDGQLDFGGPFVHGARGERALGLRWGTLADDDTFEVFRGAKLRLSDVDAALVEEAVCDGRGLVCELGLTDERGYPICASVRPPLVTWSLGPPDPA